MLCHLESSDRCRLAALCQRGVTINMPRDAASHPGFLFIYFLGGSEANLQTSDGCVAPRRHNNEEQVTLKGRLSQEEGWHQPAIRLLRRPPLYF